MGLISRIKKAFSNEDTAGARYAVFYNENTVGDLVSQLTAIQQSAVYACIRVLSESIAGLPLHLYELKDNGDSEKAKSHSLYAILGSEPNREMTAFSFWETAVTHILLWGNFYAQIIRNGRGDIVELYPLQPSNMSVKRNDKGEIVYKYRREPEDEAQSKDQAYSTIVFSQSEIFHITGLGFDGLIGYSPIELNKTAIGLTIACDRYGSSFFSNGAMPGGVLSFPGTVKDPDRVRESWAKGFSGKNANKVAVLEEGVKYEAISTDPEKAQFLDTRKFQISEIARIFRVPPHMIGDLQYSSFSNIEQQSLEFVKYTLEPWLVRIEQAIKRCLLRASEKSKYYAKFNVDGLLRGDYASRMNGYAIGIQNGYLSPNDVRRLENMNLIPAELGGDRNLVNGNMIGIDQAGQQYEEGGENNEEK